MKKKAGKKLNQWNRILELPEEVVSKQPKITIIGFDHFMIENYKGIVRYEENHIQIATYGGVIHISGVQLNLNQMKEETLSIEGTLDQIEMEKDLED